MRISGAITREVDGASEILNALNDLVAVNEGILARNPGAIPPLYRSGVRYQREARGREDWQSIASVLARRKGDCEDLASWRVAELHAAGEAAARIVLSRRGALWHVRVRRANGQIEDPSKRLGMKGAA